MTKENTLKIIDEVIEAHKKALDRVTNATKKCVDSPRIVTEMGWSFGDLTNKISNLEKLKADIENYDEDKNKVDELFYSVMPEPYRPSGVLEFSFTDKED